jgi:molecular chaperone DnaK
MLRDLSGKEPDHTVNPDEAVARGAALYAAYLMAKERGSGLHADLDITNVNSHSLGVEAIDPETLHKKNCVLIPRNTSLPVKVKERFATKMAGQQSIAVQILEGESSQPGECTAIGRTVIRDLPEGLPKNWPIEVAFQYASSGRLTVSATVPGTHHGATLELERASGMSNEGIARWKRPIGEAAGFDQFESLVEEVLAMSVDGSDMVAMTPQGVAPMKPDLDDLKVPTRADVTSAKAAAPSGRSSTPKAGDFSAMAADAEALADDDMAMFMSSPGAVGVVLAGDEASNGSPKSPLPVPRWVFNLIGHVLAAILGLGLGYLFLTWWKPESFHWFW